MFDRLRSVIARVMDRLRNRGGKRSPPPGEEPDPMRDIDFRPIDPDSPASKDDRFLCPVTRQELHPRDRIYQCKACHTAYSEAGWDFLRQTNRGKCCACGLRKTVAPMG